MGKYDFEEDPRYKVGVKQALWVGGLYVVYCIGAIVLAFPLSIFRGGTPMKFIMGFPDWVFWSILLWPVIMVAALIVIVRTKFEEVDLGPLDDRQPGKGA